MTRYKEIYNSRGIWELWHEKDWDDHIYPFYREKVKELVDTETTDNVLLYGDNGMGKSMLMNIAMKHLLHKGKKVFVIDFRHLVKEYTSSWRGGGILHDLMLMDYLAIDDLGKEFSSGEVSKELAITTLDYVIRYRFQRQKSTWLTFNMNLSDVKNSYNNHIASLLKRNTTALYFEGEDYGSKLFTQISK